jgi:autotransporter-associated beta strand protein
LSTQSITPVGTISTTGAIFSGHGNWTGTSDIYWDTPTNWSDSAAPAMSMVGATAPGLWSGFTTTDTATFGAISGSNPVTINLDNQSPSLSALSFTNSTGQYSVVPFTAIDGTVSSDALKLNAGGSDAAISQANGASNAISAPVELDSNTNVTVSSATLTMSGPIGNGGSSKTLTKLGAGTLVLSGSNNYGDTVVGNGPDSGGTLEVGNAAALPAGRALTITGSTGLVSLHLGLTAPVDLGSLNITGGSATLDVGNNKLIVRSAISTIRGQILAAYDGGKWDAPGITVQSMHSTSGGNDPLAAVGYMNIGDNVLSPPKASFGGVTLTGPGSPYTGSTLVAYTHYGDANLDGAVTIADFTQLATYFGASSATWDMGDFDYDGSVGISDFGLMRSAFASTYASGGGPFAARSGGSPGKPLAASSGGAFQASGGGGPAPMDDGSVPEPGTLVLLAGGGLTACIAGLLRRRRNRGR